MKFLTNVKKELCFIKIFEIKIFEHKIKIFGKSTMKNIVRCSKLFAKELGYKKPKIIIKDDATSKSGKDLSNECWAVYVEEK